MTASEDGRHRDPPIESQRTRLAAAVRRLIEAVTTTAASDDLLAEVTAGADRLAADLEAFAPESPGPRGLSSDLSDPHAFFPASPVIGLESPLAAPARVRFEDGRLIGDVWFGSAYEGPPGCVHGAVVSATFDEMLGVATIFSGNPGLTGTLTIRFRRTTPLRTPLRLEAWVERTEGRKTFAAGRILAGDAVTAEAEGLFVAPDPQRQPMFPGADNPMTQR